MDKGDLIIYLRNKKNRNLSGPIVCYLDNRTDYLYRVISFDVLSPTLLVRKKLTRRFLKIFRDGYGDLGLFHREQLYKNVMDHKTYWGVFYTMSKCGKLKKSQN